MRVWLLLLLAVMMAQGRRRPRGRLPIDRDKLEMGLQPRRASECRFGDHRYELEQTWNPDLGAPFGIMHCVHCECVPIYKKRRIVGRVRCRNIQSDCPKPNCAEPRLLPGRCCKVCPGQDENPDLRITVDLAREEEEKNGRLMLNKKINSCALKYEDYASLLLMDELSDMSSFGSASSSVSATGRFFFRKKTLTFAFALAPALGPVNRLTFMDAERNIIEDFAIAAEDKLCGSWERVPRRYRRQLRKDSILVQITDIHDRTVIGRISKHYGLASELFSSLLISDINVNMAATAIVSTNLENGQIHISLLLSKAILMHVIDEPSILVFVERPEEDRVVIMKRIELNLGEIFDQGLNEDENAFSIDFKTTLDLDHVEELGLGHVRIRIEDKQQQHLVEGIVVARFSCDLFDCVLINNNDDNYYMGDNNNSSSNGRERGIAWMTSRSDGAISYHIRLEELSNTAVSSLTIENDRKSKRLRRTAANLTDAYDPNQGWANGTLRLTSSDLDALYKAKLYLNVNDENRVLLRGRISNKLMGEPHRSSSPILLLPNSNSSSVISAGMAWVSLDSHCVLNYELRLASASDEQLSEQFSTLSLKDYPLAKSLKKAKKSNNLPGLMPSKSIDLQTFRGLEATGHQTHLHKLTVARLDAGDASLLIRNDELNFTLEGRLSHIRAPSSCLPRYARHELELMPGFLNDLGEERPEVELELATRCLYEGTIHEDGAQWHASHKKCHMCQCKSGKVICEPMVCPAPSCPEPVVLENECCASCPNSRNTSNDESNKGCFFEGDQSFHRAGSKWHPYLPPMGFSRCVTCTCEEDSLQVSCQRQSCPTLNCSEERQKLPHLLACCKTCEEQEPQINSNNNNNSNNENNNNNNKESNMEQPQDAPMSWVSRRSEILRNGGCAWHQDVFANGEKWHPKVARFGEMKCVNCACKDGLTRCRRKTCPPNDCRLTIKDKGQCCPRCAANEAERKQALRLRRLSKIRRLRRLRKERRNRKRNHNRRRRER